MKKGHSCQTYLTGVPLTFAIKEVKGVKTNALEDKGVKELCLNS